MDTDAAFDEIRTMISKGMGNEAIARVKDLAASDEDPIVRIKCLSLLKVIDGGEASQEILRSLMEKLPENESLLIQIAGSLRGLDYPSSAYTILKGMESTDPVLRLRCMCLEDMDEYEMALEAVQSIKDVTPFDRVMLSEVLSALGEHSRSIDNAKSLLDEMPGDFDVRRAYVSALMLAGREKEASKYVRGCLKEKTAEANALAAYAMRIFGSTKAAAGYASRALKIDPKNVSAMETLGICLAQKGEYDKARIVAGAINEASPGSRAALNVLTYCEGHRGSGSAPLPVPAGAAVQPYVLPESGREEDERRHDLQTTDPHQDREDGLQRGLQIGEVPCGSEVPESHPTVGYDRYGQTERVHHIVPVEHHDDGSDHQGRHVHHEDDQS